MFQNLHQEFIGPPPSPHLINRCITSTSHVNIHMPLFPWLISNTDQSQHDLILVICISWLTLLGASGQGKTTVFQLCTTRISEVKSRCYLVTCTLQHAFLDRVIILSIEYPKWADVCSVLIT